MMRPIAWTIIAVATAALLLTSAPQSNAAVDAAAKRAATQPTTETSPGVYLSEKYKFTLTVPADWKQMHTLEKPPVILVLTEGDPASGEAATRVRVEYRPKFQAKLDIMIPGIEKTAAEGDPKAQSSPIGTATLGGNPAKQFTVVKKIKGIETRTVYILTVKDGHLYTFAVENDAGHDPLPDTIARSFKFTN